MDKRCPACGRDLGLRFFAGRLRCPQCGVALRYNLHPLEMKRGSREIEALSGVGVVYTLQFLGFQLPCYLYLGIALLPMIWVIGDTLRFYWVEQANWPRYGVGKP